MTVDEAIFNRYRGKRILLDANLLLLWMIGSYQRSRIEVFKRTSSFTTADFDALEAIVLQFRLLVTTPHLLTEVSNLSNALPEHLKLSWWKHFQARLCYLTEVYEPALALTREPAFNPFGLSDAAVQHAAGDTLILTEDFRLAGFLHLQGIGVLNFRHLRQML